MQVDISVFHVFLHVAMQTKWCKYNALLVQTSSMFFIHFRFLYSVFSCTICSLLISQFSLCLKDKGFIIAFQYFLREVFIHGATFVSSWFLSQFISDFGILTTILKYNSICYFFACDIFFYSRWWYITYIIYFI